MNKSHLQPITLTIKVFLAMKAAVRTGLPQYVVNRHNQPIIRINYTRNQPNAFQFWDKAQKNITDIMLSVLREAV